MFIKVNNKTYQLSDLIYDDAILDPDNELRNKLAYDEFVLQRNDDNFSNCFVPKGEKITIKLNFLYINTLTTGNILYIDEKTYENIMKVDKINLR